MIVRIRRIVAVVEVVGGEISVEAEPVGAGRHERIFRVVMVSQLCRIEVPFAYVGGVVTRFVQDVGKTLVTGIHPYFVDDHPRRRGVLARQQRGTVRRAHGVSRHRIRHVGALRGKRVDFGRVCEFVAVVAYGRPPKLVGKDVNQIGTFHSSSSAPESRTSSSFFSSSGSCSSSLSARSAASFSLISASRRLFSG